MLDDSAEHPAIGSRSRKIALPNLGCRACVSLMVVFLLFACADNPSPRGSLPGSDRDPHGCIPSAGYTWCERTSRCERPWELAKSQGFPLSQEAFDEYCRNTLK